MQHHYIKSTQTVTDANLTIRYFCVFCMYIFITRKEREWSQPLSDEDSEKVKCHSGKAFMRETNLYCERYAHKTKLKQSVSNSKTWLTNDSNLSTEYFQMIELFCQIILIDLCKERISFFLILSWHYSSPLWASPAIIQSHYYSMCSYFKLSVLTLKYLRIINDREI